MSILGTLSIYSILVPLIIGMIFLKRLSFNAILIWGIVVAGTIPQLLKPVLDKTNALNIIYNIYILVEFILFYFLFREKYQVKLLKVIFQISATAYIVLLAAIVMYKGIEQDFLNELMILNCITYVLWILIYLLEQYDDDFVFLFTYRSSFFWFLSGMFFYSLCTIMVFTFWDFIETGLSYLAAVLKVIHNIFNITLYVFFSIGFIMDIKNEKVLNKIKGQ